VRSRGTGARLHFAWNDAGSLFLCRENAATRYKPGVLLVEVFTHVLLPILVMFGCGWVLDRRFGLDLGTVVKLSINIFVPAFIFVHLIEAEIEGDMALRIIGFTICIVICLFIAGALVGKMLGYTREHTRTLQIAAMFYNSANYGIPLMALAYGTVAAPLQVFVILVQNIGNFTLGVFLASSAKHAGWRAALPALRQTSVWAVACALTIRALHLPVQDVRWIWVPAKYFSDGLVGVALVTLGVQLSHTEHRQSITRIGWALVLRLLASPLLAWALVRPFGFHGEVAAIMILSASFPTAVNTALIAHEFETDSHFAAAAVFYSTVCSMVTVTVLVALLRIPAVVGAL
jgi:predicted permease